MSESPKLSDVDITILNAARGILDQQSKYNWDATPATVRAACRAEHAESAIFQFLNTANVYLQVEMTHEQLHRRPAEQVSE